MKAVTLAVLFAAFGVAVAALSRLLQPRRRRASGDGGADGGGDFGFSSHDGGGCEGGAADAGCGDGGGGDGGGD